ncbi:MAG: NfeD family protein [Lachnospiraceae bacterium]|nr:NfeD family protein [Lachnospiraceae bacterium]
MNWLIGWLVFLAILIIIELITLGFTTICFACGAGLAAILAVFNAPEWTQCVAFVIVSFVMFAFVRPAARKKIKRGRRRERALKLVGQRGRVISEIDNWKGIGQIRVQGQDWSAVSEEENVVIPVGAIVDVTGVYEDKLIICLDELMDGNVELQFSEGTLDPTYNGSNSKW